MSLERIAVSPLQPLNAKMPNEVTELGIVNKVMPVQPEKAYCPTEFTVLGISIDGKLLHPQKALLPIEVNELPKDKEFNPLQP